MPSSPEPSSRPTVLVGEADEDWTGDARFYEYSAAADPITSGAITPVPVHRFAPGTTATASGLFPLNLSTQLGVAYPATSPGMLASFLSIRPGDEVTTVPDATSELYYCLRGAGHSTFDCPLPSDGPTSGRIRWSEGDFVTLPAGCTTVHVSDGGQAGDGALLYRVTDAPLLAYLGVSPTRARFAPTRYDGAEARARLAQIERDPAAAQRSRVSVLLGNRATPQTLTITPTLWAMLGVLPVDRVQRPHRHQSAALDLIIECKPGCYTLVGPRLGPDGAIVDPTRVDWEPAGAFVTPPGHWHSHHNESGLPAYLVPIQDAGLHTYLRSLDIRFSPAPT